jgi:SAM-dependent methyltransferase
MVLAEKLLATLSRDPTSADLSAGVSEWSGRDPWENLQCFPSLKAHIRGSDVLDFGCGAGFQSEACLEAGAQSVIGVDNNAATLAVAKSKATRIPNGSQLRYVETIEPGQAQVDIIISQDSMEHFNDPEAVLNLWRSLLREDGRVYVTFGPPWLAPYGAHMHFFTSVPWVHLAFSEATVMRVRSRYRSDGATKYQDVPGGLGKMTVARFENLVQKSGFTIEWSKHDTVKSIPLARIPFLREFFTNNIAAILRPR